MKIEKVNENTIRCTLTREDLVSRHIKLSELAYGSEKAKALFREMMEQANFEFGFDTEDFPVMIEAVPISQESLILVVTKVESPDELDTRFSRFTEGDADTDQGFLDTDSVQPTFNNASAKDILDIFNRLTQASGLADSPAEATASKPSVTELNITKLFVFNDLETVIRLANCLNSFYHGDNSLYKNPADGLYYLVFSKSDCTPETYNRVCNIIAEYGDQNNFVIGTDDYMAEHYTIIARHNALSVLASLE